MRSKAAVKLVEIGQEKLRRSETRAMSISQFFSQFHEDVWAGLRDVRMEQVHQVTCAGIATALLSEA